MTREKDIWQCLECGNHQGRHDVWFEGDICSNCNEKSESFEMEATENKYDILSPDGITIENNGGYKTLKEAKKSFKNWLKRYENQGYYSSNKGRIVLEDVENYCTLIEL